MSEYNVMGAYAHEFTHEDFFWIDRWKEDGLELIAETNYDDIFGHYSSRATQQPDRYVDLSVKGNELDRIITDDQ